MSEIWTTLLGLGDKLAAHVLLSAAAIGLGIAVALPLAVWASRSRTVARVALGIGNFACGHLVGDIGAAGLRLVVSAERGEIEPLVGFDEIDTHPVRAGRVDHAEFEQGVAIAVRGAFDEAGNREVERLVGCFFDLVGFDHP